MNVKNGGSKSGFDYFLETLPKEDAKKAAALVDALMLRLNLSGRSRGYMRSDFQNAILWYARERLPIAEILRRLAPENLGCFYYDEPQDWYALDNAAKIYPLSMSRGWMPMFRLSAYLKAPVVPEILQVALLFVIRRFPGFAVTLGRGFFWDYLDSTRRRFTVRQESRRPFTVMNLSKANAVSFRVLYYENRISAEYFHVLTDGTGGMVFLKTLLAEYFRLLGVDIPATNGILDLNETSAPAEWSNDFSLAEQSDAAGFYAKPALQMRGALSAQRPHQILHFELNATDLVETAREKGATVTAFLLTCFFFACKEAAARGKGKIQIQVPCNMRKFYPSATLRNFSMYGILALAPEEISDFDAVLKRVDAELKVATSKEMLTRQMNASIKLVRTLKWLPVLIKAPVARYIYPLFSDRVLTTTLSNLGVVEVPPEMAPLIDKLDFVLGTTIKNRATCSLVTYQNKAVLSIFKATDNPVFEETLRELLASAGLTPKVTGSDAHGFHRSLPKT